MHGLSIGAAQCINSIKTFCIGKAFVGSERCAMIACSNIFKLLNMIRYIASGFSAPR